MKTPTVIVVTSIAVLLGTLLHEHADRHSLRSLSFSDRQLLVGADTNCHGTISATLPLLETCPPAGDKSCTAAVAWTSYWCAGKLWPVQVWAGCTPSGNEERAACAGKNQADIDGDEPGNHLYQDRPPKSCGIYSGKACKNPIVPRPVNPCGCGLGHNVNDMRCAPDDPTAYQDGDCGSDKSLATDNGC